MRRRRMRHLHDRGTLSTSLSMKVVKYLSRQGHSDSHIAKMFHVSPTFLKLIKQREYALTIDHLKLLASALSVPLGSLLAAVTAPPANASKKRREWFDLTARLLRLCDEAHAAILRHVNASSQGSA